MSIPAFINSFLSHCLSSFDVRNSLQLHTKSNFQIFFLGNKTLLFNVGIFVKVNSLSTLTFVLCVRCWHMIGQLIFHSVYMCPEKHLNFGLLDIAFLWLLTSLSCYYEIITRFEGDKRVVSSTWIYILLYINLLKRTPIFDTKQPHLNKNKGLNQTTILELYSKTSFVNVERFKPYFFASWRAKFSSARSNLLNISNIKLIPQNFCS
jgi:hypothetical protein